MPVYEMHHQDMGTYAPSSAGEQLLGVKMHGEAAISSIGTLEDLLSHPIAHIVDIPVTAALAWGGRHSLG